MLADLDLAVKMKKAEYKARRDRLEIEIGELQRQARECGVPLIVVFEGLEAAGKGTAINRLILPLDPRGFQVHTIAAPNEEERLRPFLWRFWIRTPAKGRIALFDRSWYRRVLDERVAGERSRREIEEAFSEINAFERQMTEAGAVIVKFWLQISRKEQAKRFRRLQSHPSTSWRVSKEDWQQNKRYREWIRAADAMIEATNTANAPWTLVEATDDRYAAVKVLDTVCRALRERLAAMAARPAKAPARKKSASVAARPEAKAVRTSILAGVDTGVRCDRPTYDKQLEEYQERLREIEHELYRKRIAMLILYEGWDAAGKGGNIKRLTARLDPRGYEVVPIAAPNDIERAHHYLWRFWMHMPKGGHITIFDRTWYGRVLVERVEGFCTPAEWQRAFQEINEIERHIANCGAVIVKFWLHISPDEQLRRFRERERTPHKRWKITAEDYRNRTKWDLYREAVDEMLLKTSTSYAPWTIVESNCKWHARLKTLRTVIEAAERAL